LPKETNAQKAVGYDTTHQKKQKSTLQRKETKHVLVPGRQMKRSKVEDKQPKDGLAQRRLSMEVAKRYGVALYALMVLRRRRCLVKTLVTA
jgi:hypothetical protein